MKTRKKILLFHLIFFLILLPAFLWPQFYYWSFFTFALFFIFFVYKLKIMSGNKGRYPYLILPFIFLSSLFFYSSLLMSNLSVLVFLFIGLVFSFYYFREMRKNLSREFILKKNKFFIWLDILALLSVFFSSSFIYSLDYFINIDNYLALIIILIILFFSIWQNISVYSIDKKKIFLFSFLFLLSISPIVWILFSFPFNYNFLGLLLLLCYYVGQKMVGLYLLNDLSNKKIRNNLIFIISFLIFIFLILKWH
jgi:hypothetical protein